MISSMVIRDFYIKRIAVYKTEAEAPLIVDGDGVLSSPLPLQSMKAVAWGHFEISNSRCEIEILQFTQSSGPHIGRKALGLAIFIQLFRVLVREGLDHVTAV